MGETMTLTSETIAALAPDQASLKAAHKLIKPAKWPVLAKGDTQVWGECQGSGATPYRTVFDASDHGYKCTCPSRKFPCKHVLALMWLYIEDPGPFADGAVPDWVTDWLGRRRKASPATTSTSPEAKSLFAARMADPDAPVDPKTAARRKAAADKRAQATETLLLQAVQDLEHWMADQLSSGLGVFLDAAQERCRTIAARLVDGKAQALSGRLDELPARIAQLSGEAKLDAVVQEFGRLLLLCRAFAAAPKDPELRRLVTVSETREALLGLTDAPRKTGMWEVIGDQVATRRDGLVSQSTWLMRLGESPATFALLRDFFPASVGKRSSTFAVGERFQAEIAYYPARVPLRAVLAERSASDSAILPWPEVAADPMQAYAQVLQAAPWSGGRPLLLPPGRVGFDGKAPWWQASEGDLALPLKAAPPEHLAGSALHKTAALWDGTTLSMLAAQTDWGLLALDG